MPNLELNLPDEILETLWKEDAAEATETAGAFVETLVRHWSPVLDEVDKLFAFVTSMAHALSGERAMGHPDASFMDKAMLLLLGRTVRTSVSTLLLARKGMVQDAYGLCRVLYETGVVTEFIRRAGEDCAERYLEHANVAHNKLVNRERQFFDGDEPLASPEVDALKERFPWGDFTSPYGWACPDVKTKKGKVIERPHLADLMNVVSSGGRGHHPVYNKAGHQLHSGAYGTVIRGSGDGVFPIGPSMYGVGVVAHSVAKALVACTIQL